MEMIFLFLGHLTKIEVGKSEAWPGASGIGSGRRRRWGMNNGGCIDQINYWINMEIILATKHMKKIITLFFFFFFSGI